MGRQRDPNEVKEALNWQIRALVSSCAAYDDGEAWEACRLATSVSVIVYDGGKRNRSILTHLGVKNGMQFVASGHDIRTPNVGSSPPLVSMIAQPGRAWYEPKLGKFPEGHRQVKFTEWWERDLIFKMGEKRLTRKKLVFGLRNLDGGSHFEELVRDPNYAAMTHYSGAYIRKGGSYVPVRQLELASMRQVAWEVLESLKLAGLHG